ncbi:MAG: hypothetical protein BWY97_00522 [Tenericutes bacterium ADurb.BinA124]|nr:MAG: hypothetical protein BWY97_00522 [Tenericutes bacterium ADurb.BinA124]
MKKTIMFVAMILIASICLFGCKDKTEVFKVTWENYNGTVLKVDENVVKGTTPEYKGDVPTKPSDADYDYEFDTWAPELRPIEGDQTYRATFKSTARNTGGEDTGGGTGDEDTGGGTGGEDTGGGTGGEDTGGGTGGEDTGGGTGGEDTGGGTNPEASPNVDFVFIDDGDGYFIKAYIGTDKDVVIPSTYNGKPVKALEKWAFFLNANLESVFIPGSIKTIGVDVFCTCIALKSVTIEEGVEKIDMCAFMACPALTSIVLPNSLKEIGDAAFAECETLESVTFGNGLETICMWAFSNCTSLVEISLPNNVKTIGEKAFGNCSSLENITIPDSIETIDLDAFADCTSLTYTLYENGKYLGNADNSYVALIEVLDTEGTSFTVHDNCKVLANSAFENYANFTTITLGNNLNNISDKAFSGCTSLTAINVPNSAKYIGANAFEGCSALKTVVLGSGVTEIRRYAFNSCAILDTINIPDGVTSIDGGAFHNCVSLTTISLPNSITHMGEEAFGGCRYLTYNEDENHRYLGNDSNPYLVFVEPYSSSSSIVVKEGCKIICDNAFYQCRKSLQSVTFPNSITHIGDGVLTDCFNLTKVVIGEENTVYDSRNDCNAIIETKANKLIAGIKTSTIPEGVRIIGREAFKYVELENVTIPDTVTTIEDRAFYGASKLTSIVIPNSVTKLGKEVFRSCKALATVTIGSGLKGIAYGSFDSCSGLTSVTMTGSTTYIGEDAFSSCVLLTSIVLPEGMVLIDDCAFYGCTALEDIKLSNSIESIGSQVFDKCNATSIIIPASVKHLFGRISWDATVPEKYYCEATSEPQGFPKYWNNDKPVYWYSDTENKDGSHWHYVDGVPTVWE